MFCKAEALITLDGDLSWRNRVHEVAVGTVRLDSYTRHRHNGRSFAFAFWVGSGNDNRGMYDGDLLSSA